MDQEQREREREREGGNEQLAGDADRERALATLRQATVEGKLTLEEFSGRMDIAMTARTRSELAGLTRDITDSAPANLPASPPARAASTTVSPPITSRIKAIMSENRRAGRWRAEGRVDVLAVMGNAKIDLRQAEIVGPELVVHVRCIMADVKIYVPKGLDVRFDVGAIMGSSKDVREGGEILPGSPIVRIEGSCVMGEVDVLSREIGKLEEWREKFLGSPNE